MSLDMIVDAQSDAGLSRFHFCRAFKESTELSPHAWLHRHRLKQAVQMLRDTDASVVSVGAALGCLRGFVQETRRRRRHVRSQQSLWR